MRFLNVHFDFNFFNSAVKIRCLFLLEFFINVS